MIHHASPNPPKQIVTIDSSRFPLQLSAAYPLKVLPSFSGLPALIAIAASWYVAMVVSMLLLKCLITEIIVNVYIIINIFK